MWFTGVSHCVNYNESYEDSLSIMISNYRLNHTYNQLLKETEVLQTDHKNLKSLLNNSKLEQTRLEAEFSKLKEQYQQLDITSTKLNNQCEVSLTNLIAVSFL